MRNIRKLFRQPNPRTHVFSFALSQPSIGLECRWSVDGAIDHGLSCISTLTQSEVPGWRADD